MIRDSALPHPQRRSFSDAPPFHRATLDRYLALLGGGNVVTAKISAFLDHATRYPTADRYCLDEILDTLRNGFLFALLRWGSPKTMYMDRGAVYGSDHLKYSLKRLDVNLVHSRPYYSKGRGLSKQRVVSAQDVHDSYVDRERPRQRQSPSSHHQILLSIPNWPRWSFSETLSNS